MSSFEAANDLEEKHQNEWRDVRAREDELRAADGVLHARMREEFIRATNDYVDARSKMDALEDVEVCPLAAPKPNVAKKN